MTVFSAFSAMAKKETEQEPTRKQRLRSGLIARNVRREAIQVAKKRAIATGQSFADVTEEDIAVGRSTVEARIGRPLSDFEGRMSTQRMKVRLPPRPQPTPEVVVQPVPVPAAPVSTPRRDMPTQPSFLPPIASFTQPDANGVIRPPELTRGNYSR